MRLLPSLAFITSTALLHAQGRERIENTDSGRVVLHYFTTGQLSTMEWMDKDERWGKSRAFDRLGKETFNYSTRRIGGHASVHFSYHPNGAISKAEVSDAPDGGIQWYRSTTTFDENGNKTGFIEQGHDDHGPIGRPELYVQPNQRLEPITEPTEMPCQRLFTNEVFVVNKARTLVAVLVKPKTGYHALEPDRILLAPGDTAFVGRYTEGEVFVSPADRALLEGVYKNRRGKERKLGVLLMGQRQVSAEHRAYFYHVQPYGTGFGLSF